MAPSPPTFSANRADRTDPMTVVAVHEERAMAEATAWLARLQGDDVGERDGLEFEAWLAAVPANAVAYRRALAVWHEFEACADDVTAQLAAEGRKVQGRTGFSRRWLVGAGGMAAAAGVAAMVLPGLLAE